MAANPNGDCNLPSPKGRGTEGEGAVYCHSEKPENQAENLRRFSDYSESQTRGSSALRLRLGGRNDEGILPRPTGEGRGEGANKAAFTLAEVLITLGIIGVIAAMTLPTLVKKYKAVELETRFKKAYSTLNQAVNKMVNDEGIIPSPDPSLVQSSRIDMRNLLQKYYIKLIDCSLYVCGDINFSSSHLYNKWIQDNYKTYNKKVNFTYAYKYIDDGMLMTTDGMLLFLDYSTNPSFLISIDLNGTKKPNAWGHDLFTFMLDKDTGKVRPVEDGLCDKTSTSAKNGLSCAKKALSEKDYFKNLP